MIFTNSFWRSDFFKNDFRENWLVEISSIGPIKILFGGTYLCFVPCYRTHNHRSLFLSCLAVRNYTPSIYRHESHLTLTSPDELSRTQPKTGPQKIYCGASHGAFISSGTLNPRLTLVTRPHLDGIHRGRNVFSPLPQKT